MGRVQCVSRSGTLPCWRCADLPRAMSGFAEESWRDRPYFSPCRRNREQASNGEGKGRAHPSSKGCSCLHFLPALGSSLPALWLLCLAPGQGFAELRRSCRLTGTGWQTSSTLMVQAPGKGHAGCASTPLGPAPRSYKPCSSVQPHAAQRWWKPQQGPLAPAASRVSTFCSTWQPLASRGGGRCHPRGLHRVLVCC